jgi:hypothetical protein
MVAERYDLDVRHRATRRVAPWIGASAVHLFALSLYDVVSDQVIGLVLNLVLLYLMGMRLGSTGTIQKTIIQLGQYSLADRSLGVASSHDAAP